jgi:hypothetical protein
MLLQVTRQLNRSFTWMSVREIRPEVAEQSQSEHIDGTSEAGLFDAFAAAQW